MVSPKNTEKPKKPCFGCGDIELVFGSVSLEKLEKPELKRA
jgi:hypothetical protein